MRSVKVVLSAVALAALAGCTSDYSPNTYASNAVQQANKVEAGIIIGFREVKISASGTVGAVTGGAAGGVLGAQNTVGVNSALGAVGGTAIGGVVGTAIEHASGDTTGWEYIVRKSNGELLSVTQREQTPIPVGQKVLVITGNQARVVPDYSVTVETAPEKAKPVEAAKPEPQPPAPAAAPVAAPARSAEPVGAPPESEAAKPAPAETVAPARPAPEVTPTETAPAAQAPKAEPVQPAEETKPVEETKPAEEPTPAAAEPAKPAEPVAPADDAVPAEAPAAAETARPEAAAPAAEGATVPRMSFSEAFPDLKEPATNP